jgi:hypothetical protein
MLSQFEYKGDARYVTRAAVPWRDRSALFDRPVGRALKQGDMVFWRDAVPPPVELDLHEGELALHFSLEGISVSLPRLLKVGDVVGFYVPVERAPPDPKDKSAPKGQAGQEYLGPFRVLSIGSRVSREGGEKAELPGADREITLAVKVQDDRKTLDAAAARLLAARKDRLGGSLPIVLLPRSSEAKQSP